MQYKIHSKFETTIEIKKSKFISYLIPVSDEKTAKDEINYLKKIHPNANHHCYAMIINDIQRSNDDGEPNSSAGIPILKELQFSNITNVLCVVVRYFGGIKLGVGGLIRAYSQSCKAVLEICDKYALIKIKKHQITFDYKYIDKIEFLLKNDIVDKVFDEKVTFTYLSNNDYLETFNEITSGTINYQFIAENILEVKQSNEK